MKKRLIIAMLVALILSLTLAAGASAKQVKPLLSRGDMAIRWTDDPTAPAPFWSGHIHGDVNGTVRFDEMPGYADLGLYTFTELFTITTRCGVIEGYDMGIWYDSGVFRACGWVTRADGKWKDLVGWMVYEDGVTVLDADGYGYTVDGLHFAFMPPLPSHWAKAWR